jgi:hypothetical protein
MVWTDLVGRATRQLVHGLRRGMFDGQACPAHAENDVQSVNTPTRSGEAKGCAKETDVRATWLPPLLDYSEIELQPRSMLTNNK